MQQSAGGSDAVVSSEAARRLRPALQRPPRRFGAAMHVRRPVEPLERRVLMSTGSAAAATGPLDGGVDGGVVGRYVFYNASAFDGRSAAADAGDDLAIAADKSALRP